MIYHLDHDAAITFTGDIPLSQMSIQILFDDAITSDEFAAAMYEEKRPVILVFPYDTENEKYENPVGISNMDCFPSYETVDENTIYYLTYTMNLNDINMLNSPRAKWYNGTIIVYNSLEKDYMMYNGDLMPDIPEDVIMQYAPWSENTPEVNAGIGDS